MAAREGFARDRDLAGELSLRSTHYLQTRFAIDAARTYFTGLPRERPLKICDFGCGQAPYRAFAAGHEYVGIDIDAKNDRADIHADVCATPLPDGAADVAVSFYVLEHVAEPQRMLDEQFRVLRPGGELYMLAPLYWEEHEQPHDYYRFTRFALAAMMARAGFAGVEIEELNGGFALLGMNLAMQCDKSRLLRPCKIPINWLFHRLDLRARRRDRAAGRTPANVMSFAVRGRKPC